MKPLNFKLLILAVSVISLVVLGLLKFASPGANILNSISGSEVKINVAPLQLEDSLIEFPYTDENKDETLIIKTDSKIYEGESSAEVYISVTNTTKNSENAVVLFYFPKTIDGESQPMLETLEQRQNYSWDLLPLFKSNIKIEEDLLKNAIKKRELIPEEQEIKGGSQIRIEPGRTAYLKLKISFPVGSSGEFWIESIGQSGGYGLLDPTYISQTTSSTDTTPGWYSTGGVWDYRRKITIDETKVSGTSNLSNFPTLVTLTYSDLKHTSFGGKVASSSIGVTGGGGDFVFTSSDGTTKLDHEIEKYASSSGELWAWVEVPTLSVTQDTSIYVYYGGPSTGATNQNVTGVWDANFKGVWHLKEAVTDEATGGTHTDSTSSAQHGVQNNNDDTTGRIGMGQSFDNVGDFIEVTDAGPLDITGALTLSAWVRMSVAQESADVVVSGVPGNSCTTATPYAILKGFRFFMGTGGACGDFISIDSAASGYNDNIWHYVVATVTGSNAMTLFVDGGSAGTNTYSGTRQVSNVVSFGAYNDGSYALNGLIDEARISNTARSADWIKTEYNNQFKPSTFYSVSGLQSRTSSTTKIAGTTTSTDTTPGWYSGNWSYRKKITVDKNKVSGSSNLSNFPTLVFRTDPDLRHTSFGGNVASSSAGVTGGGGDFVFTSSDGTTKLDHEIEKYASSSGELWAWVEVPTLSVSADTSIYVYYGGPSTGATNQNPTGVWDANYMGVWHFSENPAGTSPQMKDPANGNNGTSEGTMTSGDQVSGKVGGSLDFDGVDDRINAGTSTDFDLTVYTVCAWINPRTNGESNNGRITTKAQTTNVGGMQLMRAPNVGGTTDLVGVRSNDGAARISEINGAGFNTWQHVCATYNDAGDRKVYMYRNGVEPGYNVQATVTGTLNTFSGQALFLGGNSDGTRSYDGLIDEARISNIVRSADWIKTEYNNQSRPATFHSFGGQESRTASTIKIK